MNFDVLKNRINHILVGLGIGVIILGLLHIRACVRRHTQAGLPPSPAAVLRPQDKEVLLYNDTKHTITTIEQTGQSETKFAESPEIHVEPNGDVKVLTHAVGIQLRPFIGLGWDTGPRVHLGLSLYHFWYLDLNTSLAFTLDDHRSPQVVAFVDSLSYNVYHNTHLFVGIDPINAILNQRPTVHFGLFVAF